MFHVDTTYTIASPIECGKHNFFSCVNTSFAQTQYAEGFVYGAWSLLKS